MDPYAGDNQPCVGEIHEVSVEKRLIRSERGGTRHFVIWNREVQRRGKLLPQSVAIQTFLREPPTPHVGRVNNLKLKVHCRYRLFEKDGKWFIEILGDAE